MHVKTTYASVATVSQVYLPLLCEEPSLGTLVFHSFRALSGYSVSPVGPPLWCLKYLQNVAGSLGELKSDVNKGPLLVVALRASSKPDECLS